MSYGLVLKTPGVKEPVSLAEAKSHMRIDPALVDNGMDILIDSLIKTAREYCEGRQNRSYITQTWQMTLDRWPASNYIALPRPPLVSVTSVTYIDADDLAHTMPVTDYFYDTTSYVGRVILKFGKVWPSETLRPGAAITIEYVAGYGPVGSVTPFGPRQAMLLLIAHWYENREAVGVVGKEIELAVTSLLTMTGVY